jgi:Skp family chaperone for outer membrane proteins
MRTVRQTTIIVALIAGLGVGVSTLHPAEAQSEKIGVINLLYIVSQSTEGQAASRELKSYVKSQAAAFKRAQDRLHLEETLLRKNLPHETKAQQKKNIAAYQRGELALRNLYEKTHSRIEAKRVALLNPIRTRLLAMIKKYAQAHGFSIIFDTAEGTVYAEPQYDLTPLILKDFNQKAPG